jgi:hypothetical protein
MYNLIVLFDIEYCIVFLYAEQLLWHLFLNMYRTLVLSRLVRLILFIWLLEKGVHLALAVHCHAVLCVRFVNQVGADGKVRGCIWTIAAFMIHSIILNRDFRPLTLLPSSNPHRLCLHRWFGILTQYRWLEATALHHFTLKVL